MTVEHRKVEPVADGQRPFEPQHILGGVAIIVLFVSGLTAWSLLAPVESAVVAPGVVGVESSRRTVQHLEGGIVEAILVHEGDRVKAGDLLIQLQETQRVAMRNQLQAQLVEARATEARLIAERDGSATIAFPVDLAARPAEPEVAAALTGQTSIFDSRRRLLAERTAVLQQGIASLAEEIKGLKGQIKASHKQMSLIEEELSGVARLFAKKLVDKPRLLALQRRKAEIEGSISEYRSAIARAEQGMQEARLRTAELQATAVSEVAEQLRAVRARSYELSQQLAAAEDVLRRTAIRSPIDGTVVGLRVHTRGGVVTAGEPLLEIVPLQDKLIVQASIDPRDIDQVHEGMPAHVELTALNRRTRTPIEGSVKTVSADRLTDPQSGLGYYLARIELQQSATNRQPSVLQAGMSADVMIRTGARSPLEYLLTPITRSLGRALREN